MAPIQIPTGEYRCPSISIPTETLSREMAPILAQLAKDHPEANLPTAANAISRRLNRELNQSEDNSKDPWHTISRGEAGLFILHSLGTQRKRPLTLWEASIGSLLNHYFYGDETNWLYDPNSPERRYLAQITHINDGDTDRAIVTENDYCPGLSETLRFAGVDTPESFVSDKLERVMREVAFNLGLGDEYLPLLKTRIRYLGDLAKIANRDFTDWVQGQGVSFQVGWNYIFNTTDNNEDYWGLLQPYDKYFRRVATLYVTDPNVIARYFRERLPILMKTEGAALYASVVSEYETQFNEVVSKNKLAPGQLMALRPEAIVDPGEIFSPERGAVLAASWQGDDWTQGLIQSGFAYHYRKYDNQHRAQYAAAQQAAKDQVFGLWADPIFFYMDPEMSPSKPREESLPEGVWGPVLQPVVS